MLTLRPALRVLKKMVLILAHYLPGSLLSGMTMDGILFFMIGRLLTYCAGRFLTNFISGSV